MKINKLIALVLTTVLAISAVPAMSVQAAGEKWNKPGDSCYYLEGTDIVVKMAGEIMYVNGSGALPSYDYWSEIERPWRNAGVTTIIIGEGITSIGSYSFYKMDKVNQIQMHTGTFIEDETAFKGIAYKPIFRLYNAPLRVNYFGSIPYSSLDSIAAFAQTNTNGASYILDTNKDAVDFQNMTNPTIQLVYNAKDEKHPWTNVEENGNGNVVTRLCYMDPANVDYSIGVGGQVRYPGKACLQLFGMVIQDYNYACTINMQVTKEDKKLTHTDKAYRYVIDIPQKYRNLGMTYRLIGIAPNEVCYFDDLDTNPATVTFESDKASMTFALTYK